MTEPSDEDVLTLGRPEFLEARASGKIEFELAPQSQVDNYGPEVDEILEGLGHHEALVTDESVVGDFLRSFFGGEHKAEDDARLEEC